MNQNRPNSKVRNNRSHMIDPGRDIQSDQHPHHEPKQNQSHQNQRANSLAHISKAKFGFQPQQQANKNDRRLGARSEKDDPDYERILKANAEKLMAAEEAANSHQLSRFLVNRSHFKSQEIEALQNIYKHLTSTGKMERLRFRDLMYSVFDMTDDIVLDRLFATFDGDGQGHCSEMEFILGFSVMLRGTIEEKIAFCYECYDINGDRGLEREEVYQFLKNSMMPVPGVRPVLDEDEAREASREIAETTMRKLDVDKNGIITYADFYDACMDDPLLVECLGNCLPKEKRVKAFLTLFADDPNYFTTVLSHPSDMGWDRERNKFARKDEILEKLKSIRLAATGKTSSPRMLTFRDRNKNVTTGLAQGNSILEQVGAFKAGKLVDIGNGQALHRQAPDGKHINRGNTNRKSIDQNQIPIGTKKKNVGSRNRIFK